MRFPVLLEIRPSRRLRAALFIMHSLAAASFWLSDIATVMSLAGTFLIALSLRMAIRRTPSLRLRLHADGGVDAWREDGEFRPAEILPGVLVSRGLVAGRLRVEGERRAQPLVVLADSLESSEFRRFRVWLRCLPPVRVRRTSGEPV
jgi:hypothetical protein